MAGNEVVMREDTREFLERAKQVEIDRWSRRTRAEITRLFKEQRGCFVYAGQLDGNKYWVDVLLLDDYDECWGIAVDICSEDKRSQLPDFSIYGYSDGRVEAAESDPRLVAEMRRSWLVFFLDLALGLGYVVAALVSAFGTSPRPGSMLIGGWACLPEVGRALMCFASIWLFAKNSRWAPLLVVTAFLSWVGELYFFQGHLNAFASALVIVRAVITGTLTSMVFYLWLRQYATDKPKASSDVI